ncbi:MAG: matrixin family metalloprotease [Patescibacteria group bacterium]
MKKLLQYILLFGLIATSGYFIYQETLSPCDKTLEYSIGRFDTEFGISESEFKSYISDSEKVWEKALGRQVFVYKPEAEFKINLIYDERQLSTTQKQKTEFGLSAVEYTFRKLDAEFSVFKNKYESEVASYERELSIYKERKATYDATVSFWNKKGGAPANEYQALETERNYLNSETQNLNNQTASINAMARELNTLLLERNIKAAEYNKVAQNYNKKYSDGLEFNQAEYKSSSSFGGRGEINVYQFGNKKDLILALSHELGHALGMGHTENPKSIMYYLTGINTETTPTLSAEDLAELKRACEI